MTFFGVVFALVLMYQYSALMKRRAMVIGDGQNISSYRFDLSQPAMHDPQVNRNGSAQRLGVVGRAGR